MERVPVHDAGARPDLAALEPVHFWFLGRDELVANLLARFGAAPPVLDLGCGTGSFAARLGRGGVPTVALDRELRVRPAGVAGAAGDVLRLPYRAGAVGAVLLRDVLEHVDETPALAECRRVLRPGGLMIALVPGWPSLWGHRDERAGHRRRYTRASLRRALAQAGLEVVELRGYQFALLPVVAASRLMARRRGPAQLRREEHPPAAVNALFSRVDRAEAALARSGRRWLRPPTGSTLVAVARRPAAAVAGERAGHDHNERQRRYFTGRRLPRMDLARADTPYTRRHVEAVIAALGLSAGARAGERILDVGCGVGRYTVALRRRGLDVEAMDLTPGLLDRLREAEPAITTHVGDLAAPPAGLHGRFDVVTGFFMLHHVANLDGAFRGVRALLRPGGRAAFVEPNPLFPGYYLQITCTPGMTWRGDGGIVRMRPARLAAAAARAGLAGFTTDRFGAFPPFLANRPFGQRVERAVEAVPGWRAARAFQLFTMRAP